MGYPHDVAPSREGPIFKGDCQPRYEAQGVASNVNIFEIPVLLTAIRVLLTSTRSVYHASSSCCHRRTSQLGHRLVYTTLIHAKYCCTTGRATAPSRIFVTRRFRLPICRSGRSHTSLVLTAAMWLIMLVSFNRYRDPFQSTIFCELLVFFVTRVTARADLECSLGCFLCIGGWRE